MRMNLELQIPNKNYHSQRSQSLSQWNRVVKFGHDIQKWGKHLLETEKTYYSHHHSRSNVVLELRKLRHIFIFRTAIDLILTEISVHTGNICSDIPGAWTSLHSVHTPWMSEQIFCRILWAWLIKAYTCTKRPLNFCPLLLYWIAAKSC